LEALAEKHGFSVVRTMVLKDDEELLKETVREAMKFSDMVVMIFFIKDLH